MKFYNIHTHTTYSALDGLPSVDEYIGKAKVFGMDAVSVTDHGNLNSYFSLWKKCKKEKMKPIIGIEFYYVDDLEEWNKEFAESKELKGDDKKMENKRLSKNYHLIAISKNERGLKNLFLLNFEANKNFYRKPRIDKKLLAKHREGLIITTACMAGGIPRKLSIKDFSGAQSDVNFFKKFFGKDFYIEIQFNEMKEQFEINNALIKIAKKNDVKIVLGVDSHYLNKEDQKTHQTLLLLQGKNTYKDLENKKEGVWEFDTKELFYKGYSDVKESWKKWGKNVCEKDFFESVKSTEEIVNKVENFEIDCSIKIKDIRPDIKNKIKYMREKCLRFLKDKGKYKKEYIDRLNFELGVIEGKNFQNYFIFVEDVISDAKKKMMVSWGRGSSVGSLVCYCLGITGVDPLKYNLLFERFLNYAREEFPDVDSDFEDNDRVKKDLQEKFGEDFSNISNYSTYKISQLLSDLGRVYGIENPKYFIDLNKKIRQELKVSDDEEMEELDLESLEKNSYSLKCFCEKNPEVKRDLKNLLGKIRHVGKHAGGIVIADNLKEKISLVIKDGVTQTSLEDGGHSHTLSESGFVKIDILGLNAMKIINSCFHCISADTKTSFEKIREYYCPDNVSIDKKVFKKIFLEENFSGIFQFDTDSAKIVTRLVKPESIEELADINALNRPGTIKNNFHYLYNEFKSGKKQPYYYNSEKYEKIVKETNSVIIYQEQVTKIINEIGNVPLTDAEKVRKWFAKKMIDKPEVQEELAPIKNKFFDGCKKEGMTEKDIDDLWESLYKFSFYSFNRCLFSEEMVETESGKKKIKNVNVGESVVSFDLSENKFVESKVTNVYRNGKKLVKEYIFEDGRSVKCTKDHKFLNEFSEMEEIDSIYKRGGGLVSREMNVMKIKKIRDVGFRETYDLEVSHKDHNFVLSNKLITSNSHSVVYSYVGYIMAHLKYYYPLQFYVSLLNNSDFSDIDGIVSEIKKFGIGIKKIDLNKSLLNFSYDIEGNYILWGIAQVKGIGEIQANEIIRERGEGGEFKGFIDFVSRVNRTKVNKTVVERLIDSGAFNFDENGKGKVYLREFFVEWVDNEKKPKKLKKSIEKLQSDIDKKLKKGYNYAVAEEISVEASIYGANIEFSPFGTKEREAKIKNLVKSKKAGGFSSRTKFVLCLCDTISIVKDKRGKEMAFVGLRDYLGEKKSGLVFSSNFTKKLETGVVYAMSGQMSDKFLIDTYSDIDNLKI